MRRVNERTRPYTALARSPGVETRPLFRLSVRFQATHNLIAVRFLSVGATKPWTLLEVGDEADACGEAIGTRKKGDNKDCFKNGVVTPARRMEALDIGFLHVGRVAR